MYVSPIFKFIGDKMKILLSTLLFISTMAYSQCDLTDVRVQLKEESQTNECYDLNIHGSATVAHCHHKIMLITRSNQTFYHYESDNEWISRIDSFDFGSNTNTTTQSILNLNENTFDISVYEQTSSGRIVKEVNCKAELK